MAKVIITSGYFDPLHIGHIELLQKSKELGDILYVIVNNNQQAIIKKGNPFMDEKDRCIIIENLSMVSKVFLSGLLYSLKPFQTLKCSRYKSKPKSLSKPLSR